MPEKAKVFVAEDDPDWQNTIASLLRREGHTVVLTASTLNTGLEAIDRFKELGVQVATIDGNLSLRDTSGREGRALLAAIREKAPYVKTVGMSGLTVEGVDINIGKANAIELGRTVTKL